MKRLVAEAAIAGLLLGVLFPFFDTALNAPHLTRIAYLSYFQLVLCPVLGAICAFAFRRNFVEVVPNVNIRTVNKQMDN